MKLVHGDSLDVLKEMEANTVDTIVTDPPYGLSFMDKKWDYDVPSIELWTECLRVLKPGGTMLCFAGSRTQHRMAVNVEDAGFDIKDTIMWLYGSGFPKATDISKQLDKVVGKQGKGFKTAGDDGRKAGFEQDKSFRSDYGYKWEPTGEEAKLWNGWKSHGLKPAYEPILVAVKPNEGTYAANALKHGVSGLNIDGGRVGTDKIEQGRKGRTSDMANGTTLNKFGGQDYEKPNATGRFPANIILDEEAGEMLDEQSGVLKSGGGKKGNVKDGTGMFGSGKAFTTEDVQPDKGGASRFFYCAKASKAERNAGCEGLEEKQYSHDGRDKEIENAYQRNNSVSSNNHPTVKPLKLMEYLCTLTKTPTGGVVLDPFMGSGTTGLACKNTGRDFIGIEREAEYIEITRARLGDN